MKVNYILYNMICAVRSFQMNNTEVIHDGQSQQKLIRDKEIKS